MGTQGVGKYFGFKYHVRKGPSKRVIFMYRFGRGKEVSHKVTWGENFPGKADRTCQCPRSAPGVFEKQQGVRCSWSGVNGREMGMRAHWFQSQIV